MKPIHPRREAARLKALARYQVLNRPFQSALDNITLLAADLCHTPVAMVSFVDRDRVRLISRKGLAAKSIARKGSYCDHAIRRKDLLVVRDGWSDSRFAECAWLKSKKPLRFYAGVPLLTRQGHALGALAILDRKPRKLSGKEKIGLQALARQALELLESQRRIAELQESARKLRQKLPARQLAEKELEKSRRLLQTIYDALPDGICLADMNFKIRSCNQAVRRILGYEPEELVGQSYAILVSPELLSDPAHLRRQEELLEKGHLEREDYFLKRKNGEVFPASYSMALIKDDQGRPSGLVGTVRDITERKRAEEALRESEERYRTLVETSPDAITMTDFEGRIRMINPQGLQLYRINRMEDVLGQNSFEYISPEVRPRAMQELQEMRQTGRVRNLEYLLLRADGSTFLGEINSTVLHNEAGEPIGLMAVTRDITERRQAEAALRESEERYRILVETSPDAITVTDLEGKILMVNEQALRLYGATRMEEMLGRSAFELIAPADRARAAENLRKTLETGRTRSLEYQLFRRDGSLYPAELNASVLRNAAGQPIGFIGVTRDITERKRLEEARRESERFLANIFASIQDGISILDTEFNILRVNPTIERWYSHTQPLVGKKCYQAYHERKEFCEICPSRRTLETGEADYEIVPKRGPGGEITGWLDLYSFPLLDPARNTITGVIEYVRDITERKRLEAQVQHAQKLESLGILAGGIAHDFNNLLVSILGHAGLAQRRLPGDSPAQSNLLQIETAAHRAADLTKQMLAYSGRGAFLVQPLDLSKLVEEMAHLLEVAISKKVILNYQFASELPAIEADATQLRQVILNLITNASEALGESSGAITVGTGVTQADREYLSETYLDDNLPAGRYVYLEVSDSGCGMDRETQKKIFDPFFTTKFTGRGLGLAMVLGIVRGHKGAIKVSSEPGQGTTFKVLFPCSELPARKVETETLSLDGWRGQGTILVVDDEETVRLVTRAMLEEFGFQVLLASGGREGLELFSQHAHEIVAVLLDITMPGLSGEQTYQEILRHKPQARVILTSGYNEQEATRRFAGQGLAGFVQKPYQSLSLIQKLREVLEA